MIFELLELISTIALGVIAFSLVLLVTDKRRKERLERSCRTHAEVYKNEKYRRMISHIIDRSMGQELSLADLDKDPDFYNEVMEALNYCEFIAAGVEYGLFDERLVRTAFGGLMDALFKNSDHLIAELRMRTNRADTFRYLSHFVNR